MTSTSPILATPVSDLPLPADEALWVPTTGPELKAFLDAAVPESSRSSVASAACSILGRGISPSGTHPRRATGLVVGYVQSGKTMSFEAVAALARDNGFRIIVVIAGTSNSLLEQSTDRLCRDLGIHNDDRRRRWLHYKNPDRDDATSATMKNVIDDWTDDLVPLEKRRTILITVLKNHKRLCNLADLLEVLTIDHPALIIDDEADQASLNVEIDKGQESATYRHILRIRAALGAHSYIQYTATPQAPLLISIIDALSPDYVYVLDPGEGYVGGTQFFPDRDVPFVRIIPDIEVPTDDNQLAEPPSSLLEALRVFLIGVAIDLVQQRDSGNRSMLIHPSHRTTQHQDFYEWVRAIFDNWKATMGLPDEDLDKHELEEDFQHAYEDLEATVEQRLPPFKTLLKHLPRTFRNTQVLEVNTRKGPTPQVDWRQSFALILVGGQAMDRGFTVKGLTVTYMPRGIGIGNADTVQQRARFFGYRHPYMGYCRVYLQEATLNAFRSYVDHEETMRRELRTVQDGNLNEWTRRFILDPSLRPCRQQVVSLNYTRGLPPEWFWGPSTEFGSAAVKHNRVLVQDLLKNRPYTADEGEEERHGMHIHHIYRDISVKDIVGQLLAPLKMIAQKDSHHKTGVLLLLSLVQEQSCVVYRMSPSASERRMRSLSSDGTISQLFQGAYPAERGPRQGSVYPGDRRIHDDRLVTIQIHELDLKTVSGGVHENVPVVAVWLPPDIRRGWVVQDHPCKE